VPEASVLYIRNKRKCRHYQKKDNQILSKRDSRIDIKHWVQRDQESKYKIILSIGPNSFGQDHREIKDKNTSDAIYKHWYRYVHFQ
jgi:hypothetical protein